MKGERHTASCHDRIKHRAGQAMWSSLATAIRESARDRPADVLLVSGGLDSSLLAALANRSDQRTTAITVGFEPAGPCPAHRDLPCSCNSDLDHAATVAAHLDLDWHPVRIDQGQAFDALDTLIRLRHSFDPGLLNDIPILVGLQLARGHGAMSFWTGDDADTLFGGYRFLRNETVWPRYLASRIPTIDPPARSIGERLGLRPLFPYLDSRVLDIAREMRRDNVFALIPAESHDGPPSFVDQLDAGLVTSDQRPWGKMPQRRIAEPLLPDAIAWRPKSDLQFGSGMCALDVPLADSVDGGNRERLDRTGIRWFTDAHRGMYLRFRALGLEPRPPGNQDYGCRSCGAGVRKGRRHCPTCGAWPADV